MPWNRRENSTDSISYLNDDPDDVIYELELSSKGILSIHLKNSTNVGEVLQYFRDNVSSGFRQIASTAEGTAKIASRPLHTGSIKILKRMLGFFDIEPSAEDIALLPVPLVGVIMGSDSDLPTMQKAADIIEEFDIPVEVRIISAHRTPELVEEYAKTAYERGLRVIVAGAGGAAHLPGMIAANTALPVEGVPVIPTSATNRDGTAPLLSIVEMPEGVPVNTQGIDKAKNGGLAALQILATSRSELYQALIAYKQRINAEVVIKSKKIEEQGWRDYKKLPEQPPKRTGLLFGSLALSQKRKLALLPTTVSDNQGDPNARVKSDTSTPSLTG